MKWRKLKHPTKRNNSYSNTVPAEQSNKEYVCFLSSKAADDPPLLNKKNTHTPHVR